MKFTLPITLLAFCVSLQAQQDLSRRQSYPAQVSQAVFIGAIPPLGSLSPRTDYATADVPRAFQKRQYFRGNDAVNPQPQPQNGDPLAKALRPSDRNDPPLIISEKNFAGLTDPSDAFPPDPSGDVGKNHYMQMVNSRNGAWMQVWDKKTGASVYGPALSSTIWSQINTASFGDPFVQYDYQAERWLIMELAGVNSNELLLAVSDNSDPTGSWKAYRIQTLGFPDYPKLYVWHNAYFITVNEIVLTNVCSGYALERAAILAGSPDFKVQRFEMPTFGGIQFQPATGADWEGGPPPPPGSPGYIFRLYDDAWGDEPDHLESWEVYLDWQNSQASHIDGPGLIYPAPFETRICYGDSFSWDCIEQPGSAPRLEALESIIMYRAPYRNFGDHETVVLNHNTDVSGIVGDGGDAAVRWYELQKTPGNSWQIAQQGTYAPDDGANRFMSTISIDEAENIGLGCSASGPLLYPGLYVTGRLKNDTPGEMTFAEYPLAPGGGSYPKVRWGDYSSLTVDPYDGKTFWFSGEYLPAEGEDWATRIGAFKLQLDSFDIRPFTLTAPVSSAFLGSSENVKVQINNEGLNPADQVFAALYVDQAFVVEDQVSGVIAVGNSISHSFSKTVNLSTLGKTYHVRVITRWSKDGFSRNDTLDVEVEKRYSGNAALFQILQLPAVSCSEASSIGLVLQNSSGVPMNSAKINWRLNNQAWQHYDWNGYLLAGGKDTVLVNITGIVEGANSLEAYCSLPNGNQDQQTSNDTLSRSFTGNLQGSPLFVKVHTDAGALHWELRTLTNGLVDEGEVSDKNTKFQICAENQRCYVLILRAKSFHWEGKLSLEDLFGNVLVEAAQAGFEPQEYGLCTPARKQKDVGAVSLLSPLSGPDLGTQEPVTMEFRNFGLSLQTNISVAYRVGNGPWHTESAMGNFAPGQTATHTFIGGENLGTPGAKYPFQVRATVGGDEQPDNDLLETLVSNRYTRELELVEIINESACNDSTGAYFILKIRNNGLGEEHDFNLLVTLNGVPQQTISMHSFKAGPDQVQEAPVLIKNLKNGLNSLSFDIADVDDLGEDEVPANDKKSIQFEIDPGKVVVSMIFIADGYPEQTTWDIVDDQGNILYSGGPYSYVNEFASRFLCLDLNRCYELKLHDSGGDGLDGYISLSIDQFTLFEFSGEVFGSEYSYLFCVSAPCADLKLTAQLTQPSSAGATDGKIVAQATGGTPPYFFILNGGDLQESPVFDQVGAGAYELICLDTWGCTDDIAFQLGVSGTFEAANTSGQLTAVPNPTKGITHLEWKTEEALNTASGFVYDVRGRKLQTVQLTAWNQVLRGNIALDNYPPGVYYVQMIGAGSSSVVRIVKN